MIILWGFFLSNNFFIVSIFLFLFFILLFFIFIFIFIFFFFDRQRWATIDTYFVRRVRISLLNFNELGEKS